MTALLLYSVTHFIFTNFSSLLVPFNSNFRGLNLFGNWNQRDLHFPDPGVSSLTSISFSVAVLSLSSARDLPPPPGSTSPSGGGRAPGVVSSSRGRLPPATDLSYRGHGAGQVAP